MVQYLASASNEIMITVRSAQVGTTLTLTGPAEIVQGQIIVLNTLLKRVDSGAPIAGATVVFYQSLGGTIRQWVAVGSAVTGSDGKASLSTTTIYEGTYYYKAEFAGATVEGLTLMPSMGFWDYQAGGLPLVPILLVAGAIMLLRRR